MADMITRCPSCGTAFRITRAHLQSARGSVRCGSCLQVFNARDHLTPATRAVLAAEQRSAQKAPAHSVAPAKPPETPPRPPQPADSDDILISDDMGLDDDGDDNTIGEDDLLHQSSAGKTSLFERAPRDKGERGEEKPTEDESWALRLLDEDEALANAQNLAPTASDRPGTDMDDAPDHRASDVHSAPPNDETEETEEDIAYFDLRTDTRDWDELDDEERALVENPPLSANRQSTYLDAIEPEPVEFAFRTEHPLWKKNLLWGGLAGLALLLLLAQIAWLQYPTWSKVEPYRSVYAAVCPALGCELPPMTARSRIRASNLVVRSHPRADNALMVDVILQNTASFEQTFPHLRLTFTDLQSDIVARRQFSPDEYLGGELSGHNLMPVKQPVHIALEIVDPGAEAVNYRIDIVD